MQGDNELEEIQERIMEEKKSRNRRKKKPKIRFVEIAKSIMKDQIFKTMRDTGEIYVYNDGLYHLKGETLINEKCKEIDSEMSKHLVNETIFHIQANTYVDREKIIAPTHFIFLKNGIYDLKNRKLVSFHPEFFSTRNLPVKYDSKADCPKIKKFLSEVLDESDIPIIQELFGYCLWREYHIQKAFMFLGEGNNGKSTLLSLFKRFLGKDNISGVALQNFEGNRFSAGNLYEKLANLYADISDKALKQTGIFKMLTGGDMIYAEKKFKDGFNFVNHAKLIFSANKLPEAHDDTTAYFRRWIIINFPNQFDEEKADKDLLKKLTTEEEISGLFNFALDGLYRLLENADFSGSKTTEIIRDDYERKSNSFLAFLKDHLIFDPKFEISKENFYNFYIKYCKKWKLPAKDKGTISKQIAMHCPSIRTSQPRINGKKVWVWRGVKVEQLEQLEQSFLSSKETNEKIYNFIDKKHDNIKVKKNPVPTVPPVPKFEEWKKSTEKEPKHIGFLKNVYGFTEKDLEKLKKEGKIMETTPGKYKIV